MRNNRNERGCVRFETGGAFISQRKRWSGVFAPARANENKTIHEVIQYPSCRVQERRTMSRAELFV